MTYGYSVDQIRAAEAPHRAAGEPLMLRAAAALAREIRAVLPPAADPHPASVLLLVGSGDNGGDALLAGADLARGGVPVSVVSTAGRMHAEGRGAAEAAGVEILEGGQVDVAALASVARNTSVVVDGILGTGTSADPALRGRAREVVEAIRPVTDAAEGPVVVAVDIPSGVGPDDGAVPDPAVLAADVTVTFGGCKAGLLREPAATYAGRIVVVDIGIGAELATMTPTVQSGSVPGPA
jgi:NAD(P)H-hydrate epimerase